MNEKQFEECRRAFLEWNNTPELRKEDIDLWQGWFQCYSWIINNNKRAFDEMLDEMYNSYKQENFGGKDEP